MCDFISLNIAVAVTYVTLVTGLSNSDFIPLPILESWSTFECVYNDRMTAMQMTVAFFRDCKSVSNSYVEVEAKLQHILTSNVSATLVIIRQLCCLGGSVLSQLANWSTSPFSHFKRVIYRNKFLTVELHLCSIHYIYA